MLITFSSLTAGAELSCSAFLKHKITDFDLAYNAEEQSIQASYKGENAAIISYSFDRFDNELSVYAIEVEMDFRRNSLAKTLLKSVLDMHPETETISTTLTQVNEQVYKDKKREIVQGRRDRRPTYEDGLEALKHTPAYLIRAALGFSQIVEYYRGSKSISLVVKRDDVED